MDIRNTKQGAHVDSETVKREAEVKASKVRSVALDAADVAQVSSKFAYSAKYTDYMIVFRTSSPKQRTRLPQQTFFSTTYRVRQTLRPQKANTTCKMQRPPVRRTSRLRKRTPEVRSQQLR